MCGRFALWSDKNRLVSHYGLSGTPGYSTSYNIAPSAHIPVIRNHHGFEAALCHWGLIPHWARDTKLKPINARAETIGEKPFFRDAFRQRRCLIPANGYYEWKTIAGRKQPYFIRMKETELFSFAGVWSSWQGPDGAATESCAIITTGANDELSAIHHRMPVIIEPDDHAAWLHEGGGELLKPCTGKVEACRVSDRVNNPRHQGEVLVQPL